MIEVNNLFKSYGDKTIFEDVSCSLKNHRIYALVGINGIGKSTLLNAITQPFSFDRGKVSIDGINNRLFEVKFHFFYVPDSKEMFLNLTGAEYLKFIIQLYRQDEKIAEEKLKRLSVMFKLDRSLNEYIANYSLGMKQKVYLMAAFLSGASNLILDEPFNGLGQDGVEDVHQLLQKLKKEGKCILLASHSATDISKACDEVYKIKEGKIYRS